MKTPTSNFQNPGSNAMKTIRAATGLLGVLIVAAWANAANAQADPRFGSRSVRTCASVTSPPNVQQASMLIQCGYERASHDFIFLVEQVQVQIGGSRPFNSFADGYATDIDASAKVLPLRGTSIAYTCGAVSDSGPSNRGKNCVNERNNDASGICWRTTFKDWRCSMIQTIGSQKAFEQPPPQ